MRSTEHYGLVRGLEGMCKFCGFYGRREMYVYITLVYAEFIASIAHAKARRNV